MNDSRISIIDYDTAKEILDLLELRPKSDRALLSVFGDDSSFFALMGRDRLFIIMRFDTKKEAVVFASALAKIFNHTI